MADSLAADGSEDVNDFLQRIKELGERRDSEDEERTRKLEEEILQGRKERQARRAERARSISPTKSSPANTPTSTRISTVQTDPATDQNPSRTLPTAQSQDTGIEDAMDRLIGNSKPAANENVNLSDTSRTAGEHDNKQTVSSAPSSNAMPSRTPTLSWQRRPASSDRPKSRPLSMVATENAARSPRSTPSNDASSPERTMSRDQIAQSLASKTPDWFKQTADRGLNSPAYRKSQVEDLDRADHGLTGSRIQIPGMVRESSANDKELDEAVTSESPTSRSTRLGNDNYAKPNISSSLGSPMPLTPAQILDPPGDTRSEARSLAMSPSQGRISPHRHDRPVSPTKGMGGFVQSAMMKRSDSVNKRWSVQSPAGLSRGNSVASNRASHDLGATSSNTAAGKDMVLSGLSRENSPHPSSRPSSSHSNTTITQDRPGTSSSMKSSMTASTNDSSTKLTVPVSRTSMPLETGSSLNDDLTDSSPQPDKTLPTSPSKTMDSRRWSPTKASWLESALNKPESPRPKAVQPPQQPAWMSEINKAKQKTSVDLGRAPPGTQKHDVSIGGLLRSPPMGGSAKPVTVGGLPAGFSAGPVPKGRSDSIVSQERKWSIDSGANPTTAKPSPLAAKIKPETPPKKDFRASLKPRQAPTDISSSNEPEFKNVFGQLRRTKTQNYVAPDELKDNITRGKSALSITGGPKKTERRDEFKDAILKKKEDFKQAQLDGKGINRSSNGTQDAPLPEALARRQALGRSGSLADSEAVPSPLSLQSKAGAPGPPKPTLLKETSSPARLEGKEPGIGKLAGRLNPNLAGLLARGPPPASDSSRSSSPALSRTSDSKAESTAEPTENGPQLTHMTKARARGPRRKAPSNIAAPAGHAPERNVVAGAKNVTSPTESKVAPKPDNEKEQSQPSSPRKLDVSENPESQPSSPRKLDLKRRSQFLQEAPKSADEPEAKAGYAKSLSTVQQPSAIGATSQLQEPKLEKQIPKPKPGALVPASTLASNRSVISSAAFRPDISETASSRHQSPYAPKSKAMAISSSETNDIINAGAQSSVKGSTTQWENDRSTHSSPRVKSPIKLPTHQDEKAAMVRAGLRPASPVKSAPSNDLDIAGTRAMARPLPTPPNKGPLSPPLGADLRSPQSVSSGARSTAQPSDAPQMLHDFFGEHEAATAFKFDTTSLLAARPAQSMNIKTLRSSLYLLSADGKKQSVPNHQERILFEENLYLCTHVFGDASGRKINEVYLWRGAEVTNSVVEGCRVFAEREARMAGGTLITIRQGKETPEFLSALGGIVIIRRGSANKYDSLAPHILCGRKHFGQIAFDEVDFSEKSLCSGFPYLISSPSGKCYLWKGRGSSIEELSCARLIGMDFGLTGEIEEIEDGKEPQSFLDIFGNGSQVPKSADHWRMKPNYNKYCIRLFIADADSREQIQELSPFCQFDLNVDKIYILDAFFEIYIIVGSASQSQYSAFHNALMFAQEYGILAAGMEDRPFVPVTTVVLEGVPKDMKAVFRKWEESLSPTYRRPVEQSANTGGLRRGRSLRVLPLTAALEATRH